MASQIKMDVFQPVLPALARTVPSVSMMVKRQYVNLAVMDLSQALMEKTVWKELLIARQRIILHSQEILNQKKISIIAQNVTKDIIGMGRSVINALQTVLNATILRIK